MKKRTITSVFIMLGLGSAFATRFFTPFIFDLLMLGLAVMGAVEVARVLERQHKYTNFIAVGTMPAVLYLCIMLVLKLELQWQYLILVFLCAVVVYFLVIFLVTLLAKKTSAEEMKKYELTNTKLSKYALDKSIYSLTVLVYPTLLFMSLILLNHFNEFNFVNTSLYTFKEFTWFAILSVFVVTMMTDTMAYLVGSTVKGPKLCPLISPNKTISGAVGGLVGGVVSGMGLFGLFSLNSNFVKQLKFINASWWIFLAIFLLGSILSQIGDIAASALKRRSRVKDYGTIFPGHGGVMDRMDGNIFNAFLSFVAFLLIFIV